MVLRWFTALFDLILPRHARAKRARAVSSEEIAKRVAPTTLRRAPWIHTLLPYRDPLVREIIQAIKYYGEKELVQKIAPFAADYLLDVIGEKRAFSGWSDARIVEVPSSPKRLRERGYNQAALLAQAIAEELRVPYAPGVLQREERVSQVHVPKARRSENVHGAFSTRMPESIRGRHVILIDDVTESGATLAEARRALLEAGAKDVIALAIAH